MAKDPLFCVARGISSVALAKEEVERHYKLVLVGVIFCVRSLKKTFFVLLYGMFFRKADGMDYGVFFDGESRRPPKVSERKQSVLDIVQRLTAEGEILSPAVAHGKAIANKTWGREWCSAVNEWQDYESRLPAGRSLLKNGAVIDLKISPNRVDARVVDGLLYSVSIFFSVPDESELGDLKSQLTGRLSSLIDFIQGNLSEEVIQIICQQKYGLFPQHSEFRTSCDCIDDSVLCKHAAAVLYGIGARLDDDPALFFTLRGIKPEDFFQSAQTLEETGEQIQGSADMSNEEIANVFGIEIG